MGNTGSGDNIQHMADLAFDLENNPPSGDPEKVTDGDIVTYLSLRHQVLLYGARCDHTSDTPSQVPWQANISHSSVICEDLFAKKDDYLNSSHKLSHEVGGPSECFGRSATNLDRQSNREYCQTYDRESSSDDHLQPHMPDTSSLTNIPRRSTEGITDSCYSSYVKFLRGAHECLTNMPHFVFEEPVASQVELCILNKSDVELIGHALNALFESPKLVHSLMATEIDYTGDLVKDQLCHKNPTSCNSLPKSTDRGSHNKAYCTKSSNIGSCIKTYSSNPTCSESENSQCRTKRTADGYIGDSPSKLPKTSHVDPYQHAVRTGGSNPDCHAYIQSPTVASFREEIKPNLTKTALNFNAGSTNLGLTSSVGCSTSNDHQINQKTNDPVIKEVPDEFNLAAGCTSSVTGGHDNITHCPQETVFETFTLRQFVGMVKKTIELFRTDIHHAAVDCLVVKTEYNFGPSLFDNVTHEQGSGYRHIDGSRAAPTQHVDALTGEAEPDLAKPPLRSSGHSAHAGCTSSGRQHKDITHNEQATPQSTSKTSRIKETLMGWATVNIPQPTNQDDAIFFKAGGHLFLELVFPQSAAAKLWSNFKQSHRRSFVESGQAYRQQPAQGVWVPSGSKVEGLALHKGYGQQDSDIDNMYMYGGAWGVLVEGSETDGSAEGTTENYIDDNSGGDDLKELCTDQCSKASHTPTDSGDGKGNNYIHYQSDNCDDPASAAPSTSIPPVSSDQSCSACNNISLCGMESDTSNYFATEHIFTDDDPSPSDYVVHECDGSTPDEISNTCDYASSSTDSSPIFQTERLGSHTQPRNVEDNAKAETPLFRPSPMSVEYGKMYIVVGGKDSDSESENSDPGEQSKKTDEGISKDCRLVLDKTNCPAAYCRVRVEGNISELTSAMGGAWTPRDIVSKRKAKKCVIEREGKHWLSSEKSIQALLDVPPSRTQIIQGPAGSTFEGQWDAVPALICSGPLPEIRNFLKRPRGGPWPSKTVLGRIANMPAVLVAAGHKLSSEKELEWRYSWSLSELLLAEHMPVWVKQAYWAFKYTVKRMLANHKDKQAIGHPVFRRLIPMVYKDSEPSDQGRSKLCSFHLKTTLLWELEEKEAWQDQCPFTLFLRLSRRWTDYLRIGQLPHYFLEDCDLLECVSSEDMTTALHCVEHIVANPHDSLVRAPEFACEVYGGPDHQEEFSRYKHSDELTLLLKLACDKDSLPIALELLHFYGRLYDRIGLGLQTDFGNLTKLVEKKWEAVDTHRKKQYEQLVDSDVRGRMFGREKPIVLAKLMRDICNGFFI